MPHVVENIPDQDCLSRLVFFPRMYDTQEQLIWLRVFEFPGGECESVVWRKYANTADDVHLLGDELEAIKREHGREVEYRGFTTAGAGEIRNIQTTAGNGFSVEHAPSEGLPHAEICYRLADQVKLSKPEKADLKEALRKVFGPVSKPGNRNGQ